MRKEAKSSLMKLVGYFYPALLTLLISGASYGAQKAIRWEDGAMCEFETRFDPAKIDEEKLGNTVEVIFGDGFYKKPTLVTALIGPGGSLVSNTAEYQQACERERVRVENLAVLDLPGIENYRKWSLEEFDETCRFDVLKGRAASGDPAALREFTPSAAKCSPFIDALEGKTNIRAVWRDMIGSFCQSFSKPTECRADFLKAESRPNAEDAIRLDVLGFGWNNCSTAYLKTGDLSHREAMRAALEKSFRRRFKVKVFPCAD
jgi:hypothetical protein